jgi:hypothetical protein
MGVRHAIIALALRFMTLLRVTTGAAFLVVEKILDRIDLLPAQSSAELASC